MNKRGMQITYTSVFYLALGTFVLLWFLGGSKAIAQNTYIQQEYYGKDIALLIDTLQIADGDVEIRYPSREGFSYNVENGRVVVREKIPYVAYYGEDLNDTFRLDREGNLIVIEKHE